MAYVAPAVMAALTDVPAQDWISSHLQPNDNQMDHLLHHVYSNPNQVLNVYRLTSQEKYAVLRQGVTSIADVCMLGATVETICDNFKHFNSLTEAHGGTNLGAIHYTRIHALTEYVRDWQCWHGQLPDPAGFTNVVMNEYIERSGVNGKAGDKSNGDRNVIYLDPHADYKPTTQHTNEIEDHTLISGIDMKDGPICHCDQCGQVDPDFLTLSQLSSTLDPTTFAHDIIASVNIAKARSSMITQQHLAVMPEHISEVFGCGLETAKQTIRVMTQHGVRSAMHPLRRHYRTDLLSIRYCRLSGSMYSDTMHFKVKSLNQNKCPQIFATDIYATAYPVHAERHIGDMLRSLAKDIGILCKLLTDNANAMMGI